jgi:Prp8 binding protein
VCIWEVDSGKILYKVCTTPSIFLVAVLTPLIQLPGHKGTVTAVDFHPKEPISKHLSSCWFISLTLFGQS